MKNRERKTIGLQEVLDAKERRAGVQAELRSLHQAGVISISVNMPGNVKYCEDTIRLLYTAVAKIREALATGDFVLLEERILHDRGGPAALLAVRGNAADLKRMGVSLEEKEPYGRLLDIDVFDAAGRQFTRSGEGLPARRCLVCAGTAIDCMRGRRHRPEEVLKAARDLLVRHRAEEEVQFQVPGLSNS